MKTEAFRRIYVVLDDLESGGYEDFMNYAVVRQLLSAHPNAFTRLYERILARRPHLDTVNLVCTVNGALNYVACRLMSVDEALRHFDEVACFEAFIEYHGSQIERIALIRTNNPTIPQRAFPVACHLPEGEDGTGMLELGCSRGDIGLVLLNHAQVLACPSRYLFPDFMANVSTGTLKRSQPVARYFGVDLEIAVDDAWLLSLWGMRDARRQHLQSFYADFKPEDSARFQRVQADACNLDAYLDAALGFFGDTEELVILTSFMVYQLSYRERKTLARRVRLLQDRFRELGGCITRVTWYNQGIEPQLLMTGDFDFSRCYLSRLWFDGDDLHGIPLVRLANDACEGWDKLEASPVVVG